MIWIFTFLIGFLGISFLLYREVLVLRKHNISVEDIGEKTIISREKVSDLVENLWYSLKLNTHRIIISALKGWVVFTHKINKYIKDKLASRPEGNSNETVSNLLFTVSEYKQKMKKMRERMKHKDE